MIDPHVHLRDWGEAVKESMAHGLSVAWKAGISGLFEMPNTDPPLTGRGAAVRRIAEADHLLDRLAIPLFHGMYLGLTADEGQIKEVIQLYRELFPRVVGFKLYAGHSTGRMGVTDTAGQLAVWKALATHDYRGVAAVHAEREDLLRPDLWDSGRPQTHAPARPPLAEIASVQTQLALAESAGFRGHLHICHVSLSDTVTLVRAEASSLPFSVSLGVTPHHLLLNEQVAFRSSVPEWKVNPPLRDEENRRALWSALEEGRIDWIESDHAPHTLADKKSGASGLPGLPGYRLLVERLAGYTAGSAGGGRGQGGGGSTGGERGEEGASAAFAPSELSALTGEAVCRVFGIEARHFPDNPYSPLSTGGRSRSSIDGSAHSAYAHLAGEYPWDPYRFIC